MDFCVLIFPHIDYCHEYDLKDRKGAAIMMTAAPLGLCIITSNSIITQFTN